MGRSYRFRLPRARRKLCTQWRALWVAATRARGHGQEDSGLVHSGAGRIQRLLDPSGPMRERRKGSRERNRRFRSLGCIRRGRAGSGDSSIELGGNRKGEPGVARVLGHFYLSAPSGSASTASRVDRRQPRNPCGKEWAHGPARYNADIGPERICEKICRAGVSRRKVRLKDFNREAD